MFVTVKCKGNCPSGNDAGALQEGFPMYLTLGNKLEMLTLYLQQRNSRH